MPKVSGAISNIVSGAMGAASRAQSTAQSGQNAQAIAQAKLDKENRDIRRKAIDEALKMGNHALAKKLMEGAPKGVDVSLFQAIIDTPSLGQQKFQSLSEQLIALKGPQQPSAAPVAPFLPSTTHATTVSGLSIPATPQAYMGRSGTSLAPTQDLLKKWSVSVGPKGVTFTSRAPKTAKERVTEEYINSLSPDAQAELGQALAEGATSVTQQQTKQKDGSVTEQTIWSRGGKTIRKGPVREIEFSDAAKLAQQTKQIEETTRARGEAEEKVKVKYEDTETAREVRRKIALNEAVPPSLQERAYEEYVTARRETKAPTMSIVEWQMYNTSTGHEATVKNFGAQLDNFGRMTTNLADYEAGQKIRMRRGKQWIEAYALAEHYGVSSFTLMTLTQRIFSSLHMREDEVKDLDKILQKLKAKYSESR